jgi:aromatic ring-opening dioxygenase catalytic subunit (LigB family)
MSSQRMPVAFIPHGGGPWPFVDLPMFEPGEVAALKDYLRSFPQTLGVAPQALLVVSAHWEEPVPTVMSAPSPPVLYDYFGFPPESYEITWPAPGSPELAQRVRELLRSAGFETACNDSRGFDHGTFIPLKVMYPNADIPTVELSLIGRLDPDTHLALGRALAPLRDESVLILGSGMSYHNVSRLMRRQGRIESEAFDAWLRDAATSAPDQRSERLADWQVAPYARIAHPREDHLLPLMVIAGAAGDDRGEVAFSGSFGDARISAFLYR